LVWVRGVAAIFALATADPFGANCNLSAAINPYGTYNNRCSTITDTYGAGDNLSATTNPKPHDQCGYGTRDDLSSTTVNP
jgi:hypothetical protein